jgi:hypothetical protein
MSVQFQPVYSTPSIDTNTRFITEFLGQINAKAGGGAGFAGKVVTVQLTPTVTANTYTAGDSIGGLLTFPNAVGPTGTGVLQEASVVSKGSVQTTALKLYLFSAAPSQTFTDHTAAAWTQADFTNLIGVWSLAAVSSGLGTMTFWDAASQNKAIALGAGVTTLYGVLQVVTTTTNALSSTSDIAVNLTIQQNG